MAIKTGFAHPYFPSRDPERRWLFKLTLTMPRGISINGGGDPGNGPTVSGAEEVLSLSAQNVTVPTVTMDAIVIPHMNQDVKVAGRPTLGEMSVTILNSYDLQAVRIIEAWHRLIYDPAKEQLGFAASYKTNGTLFVYKPNFEIFKNYSIQGCWPSSVGDKEYDWSTSDSVTRTITFQVDKVIGNDNPAA